MACRRAIVSDVTRFACVLTDLRAMLAARDPSGCLVTEVKTVARLLREIGALVFDL